MTDRRPLSILILLLLAASMVAFIAPAPQVAAVHPTFAAGDIFAGLQGGRVNWYHADGTLRMTMTGGTGTYSTGMAFDATGRMLSTQFLGTPGISRFNTDGSYDMNVGSGFNTNPESMVKSAAGGYFVGQADGSGDVLQFDAALNLVDSFNVATGARGSDFVELAADQCTVYYNSEDYPTGTIRRYDVCNDTQLTNFATGFSAPSGAYGLRLLPGGGLLTAASSQILRFDGAGNVIQMYDDTSLNYWFALNLDPDGTSFWSADLFTGSIRKFDIATGNILLAIEAGELVGGLSVFGEITVADPPECSDNKDNADPEDTLADFPNDPGCTSPLDDNEANSGGGCPPPTGDGGTRETFAGDGDGSDPCDPTTGSEGGGDTGGGGSSNRCHDKHDNDGDGLVDYPDDPGCTSENDTDERSTIQCDDGKDNDKDGLIDYQLVPEPGYGDLECDGPLDDDEKNGGGAAAKFHGNDMNQNCRFDINEVFGAINQYLANPGTHDINVVFQAINAYLSGPPDGAYHSSQQQFASYTSCP